MPAESQFTICLISQLIAEQIQHLEMRMTQRRVRKTVRRNHNPAYRNLGTRVIVQEALKPCFELSKKS